MCEIKKTNYYYLTLKVRPPECVRFKSHSTPVGFDMQDYECDDDPGYWSYTSVKSATSN